MNIDQEQVIKKMPHILTMRHFSLEGIDLCAIQAQEPM